MDPNFRPFDPQVLKYVKNCNIIKAGEIMEKVSEKITAYLLEGKSVTDDEFDEIRFGVELVLTQSILIFIIFAIGLLLGQLLETIIFVVVMVSLRTLVDGYHADSFQKCMFITTTVYVICMLIYHYLNGYILTLMLLFSAKAFWFQESSLLEKNILRSQVLFVIYLILIVMFYQIPMISYVIGFTVFMTAISMEVKRYNDKRKSLQNGEKNR